MELATLISLLTAVGASGLVVNWVAEGKSRRQVRGDVLKRVTEVETKRWAGQQHTYREFQTALYDLQTAALVARIPLQAVHQYVVLAEVARRLSDDSFAFYNGDFDAGAGEMNGEFAQLVRDSARMITKLAWNPVKTRFWMNDDLKKIRSKLGLLEDHDVRDQLDISERIHGPLLGPPLPELPPVKPTPPPWEVPTNDEELFGKAPSKDGNQDTDQGAEQTPGENLP